VEVLEFCRERAPEIEVLQDEKALFLLTFIAELGRTSRHTLLSHLGWSEEIFDALWRKLKTAELVRDESTFGRESPLRLSVRGTDFIAAVRFPVSQPLQTSSILAEFFQEMAPALHLDVHGRFSSGKSTLLDAILGKEIVPEASELLRRAREGDREAFDSLFRALGPTLYRACMDILHNPADAEDAVQQTFLKVLSGASLPAKLPVPAMFRMMARNVSFDMLRRKHRRHEEPLDEARLEEPDLPRPEWLDEFGWAELRRSHPDVPVRVEAAQEKRAMLAEALSRLREIERYVLDLWLEGMTTAETAAILEMSRSSVDKIRQRALSSLIVELVRGRQESKE
jgi:RNA polymerase sigma-70 factor (ECF subfamily)